MDSKISGYFILILFCLLAVDGFSQSGKSVLEKPVSISVVDEKLDIVLNKLSQQTGAAFSYNPAVIDISKNISCNFVNKPLREVLNKIFDGKIEYKLKGKYLILQKKQPKPVTKAAKEFIEISGYVRTFSGTPIAWTSIYNKESLSSTVTNDYGFYKMRFNVQQLPLNLYFNKQGFNDTVLVINITSPDFINITLTEKIKPEPPKLNVDSLEQSAEETASSFFQPLEDPFNSQNITDTLYRTWQVSLLPFVGSNGKLSGNVINDYSFNIFGGYSMGVKKAELSGFLNLNRGDVQYVQLAGFSNVIAGEIQGVQMAGFSNLVRRNVKGVQLAGFSNVDFENFNGAQGAGFANVVLDTITGFQGAGFLNFGGKTVIGVQLAGFCNVALDSVKGAQIGFINYTRKLAGSQVGFLNFSESTTGVPVGFLSYVHKGYHKIEISADEVFYTNIALRTGVRVFHNILTSGVNPSTDSLLLWHFGYGIGSTLNLGKKAGLDFDVTASQIVKGDNFDKINLLAKTYVGVDVKLAKQFSLALGVTVNGQITKTNYEGYPDIFTWYEPNIFHEEVWESEEVRLKMWLGGKIGLRFF